MLRILVPIDGSKSSERVVDYLIRQSGSYGAAGVELHLVNVQPAMSGRTSALVSRSALKRYHQEEGERALKPARKRLDAAKVAYSHHISVGEPAEVIAGYIKELKCNQVAMGTRGMGTVSNLLLGSVATKVIHLSPVPILLVK